ncbi:MAG: tRNA pseudouridine(38-40) synthase TruA, partial [Sediminispirochaetaceae bacterium]
MRIKLLLAYDGTRYCGWQRQPDQATVQETVEAAVAKLVGIETPVIASGRTDSGVHARGQVCHFDVEQG